MSWKEKKIYITKTKWNSWTDGWTVSRKIREDGGRTARVDGPWIQVIWMRREEGWFRMTDRCSESDRKETDVFEGHSNPNRCTGPQTLTQTTPTTTHCTKPWILNAQSFGLFQMNYLKQDTLRWSEWLQFSTSAENWETSEISLLVHFYHIKMYFYK